MGILDGGSHHRDGRDLDGMVTNDGVGVPGQSSVGGSMMDIVDHCAAPLSTRELPRSAVSTHSYVNGASDVGLSWSWASAWSGLLWATSLTTSGTSRVSLPASWAAEASHPSS